MRMTWPVGAFLVLVAMPLTAQNNPDPCPKAERQFKESRGNAENAATTYRAKLESVQFDESAFEKAVKEQLVLQTKIDVKDTVDAFNAQLVEDCQLKDCRPGLKATDQFLAGMAKKKVEATWARDSTKQHYAEMLEKAKAAFAESKQQALAKFDNDFAATKASFDEEQKKLEANCNYGFLPTLVRLVAVLLQIDTRIENGMLKIGDFKTQVPEVYGGKVMLGDHHLFNIPEVKGQNVEIGGTVIFTAPQVVENGTMIQWGELKTDIIPKIDIKLNGSHGGLGVETKLFGTTIKF